MALTNLVPRTENITGASLTGSSGATNRTYTVAFDNMLASGIQVQVQGAPLHQTSDFTVAGQVITFLNAVDNTDVIAIYYFTTLTLDTSITVTTTTELKYATPLQLASILGIKKDIPSWAVAATPTNEAVGTGDNSNDTFYLDHQHIISDSYTLYANSVAMTETTHYTLDKDTGKITLTAAGVTLLSTNALTAEYSYYGLAIDDSYVVQVLLRAETEVDRALNTTFTDGSVQNPSYPSETEFKDSQGLWNRDVFAKHRPIIDVSSTLNENISASDTSLTVASGHGANFPASGTIIIGTEIITYGSVSGDVLQSLTRGVNDSTAAAHTAGAEIHTTVMELSAEEEGTAPTYTPLAWNSEMILADADLGKLYIYLDTSRQTGTITASRLNIRSDIPRRIRLNYFYGHNTVPVDITRLTLLFAKKMLMADTVGSSIVQGRDEFRPEMMNADEIEIQRIVESRRILPMGRT